MTLCSYRAVLTLVLGAQKDGLIETVFEYPQHMLIMPEEKLIGIGFLMVERK